MQRVLRVPPRPPAALAGADRADHGLPDAELAAGRGGVEPAAGPDDLEGHLDAEVEGEEGEEVHDVRHDGVDVVWGVAWGA